MATKNKQSKSIKKVEKKAQPVKKPAVKKSQKKPEKKKPAAKKQAIKTAKSAGGAQQSPTKTSFSLSNIIQRQSEVAWRLIDGEAVVITPVDSTMHSLNDTGTRIWEAIDGQRSLKQVANIVAAEFEVDRGRAEKDTLWFVECLAKKGLVDKV
jgi:hypothetical protein